MKTTSAAGGAAAGASEATDSGAPASQPEGSGSSTVSQGGAADAGGGPSGSGGTIGAGGNSAGMGADKSSAGAGAGGHGPDESSAGAGGTAGGNGPDEGSAGVGPGGNGGGGQGGQGQGGETSGPSNVPDCADAGPCCETLALTGVLDTAGSATQVAVSGTTAFVADGANGLVIADVADPSAPTVIDTFQRDTAVVDIALSGNTAYLVDQEGLVILDVADPGSPTVLSTFEAPEAIALAVDGDRAVVISSFAMVVVDISDPSAPERWTSVPDAHVDVLSVEMVDVALAENLVYVLWQSGELRISDISQRGVPPLLGDLATNCSALDGGIALSGQTLYMVGGYAGFDGGCLDIVSVSDPAEPDDVPTPVGGGNTAVAILGDFALITRDGALLLVDLVDATDPRLVASLPTEADPLGVAVSGSRAFVAAGDAGLLVVDVDPNCR